jgi:ABC-type transport system involved in Fe-S cluster assembly fused permease/ATPase subunit
MNIYKILCYTFGHRWKFNFKSIPNKAICSVCKSKSKLNLSTLNWEEVKDFGNDYRTDKELIETWH